MGIMDRLMNWLYGPPPEPLQRPNPAYVQQRQRERDAYVLREKRREVEALLWTKGQIDILRGDGDATER